MKDQTHKNTVSIQTALDNIYTVIFTLLYLSHSSKRPY